MTSSIPGCERKNSSHDSKSWVLYSQRGTRRGPPCVDRIVQRFSLHGQARFVSRRRHICGSDSRSYLVKHFGQQIARMMLGSIKRADMALRTSLGKAVPARSVADGAVAVVGSARI